ncbi:hypothetical protein DLAC_00588 [Tieghemostelium lacteum]|uniref:Uncharacterized protein n=1 Tax=Tieghemostelium lacteum TaxID=361077 RepID=A0A152AA47_TIELA|nr:hypothetical protein DLAC_00588 [Tieghemostelium lacteum]|eukprot:KYR03096.1 hypothetical protein DLAC_00588 [Tieghemostelium lacteum]
MTKSNLKVLILLIILSLIVSNVYPKIMESDDDDNDINVDVNVDADGDVTFNYNENISVNGDSTTKTVHFEGSDIQYSSKTELDIDFNGTKSAEFSYLVRRDPTCDTDDDDDDDAELVIKHAGKVGGSVPFYYIKLINFTCDPSTSRPAVLVSPSDGTLGCTLKTLGDGVKIDCLYN